VLAWLSVWGEVLMPLPLAVFCLSKIQIGLTFWCWLTWVVPDKGLLNGCCSWSALLCLHQMEINQLKKSCKTTVITGKPEKNGH